jgi:hypothetical protein
VASWVRSDDLHTGAVIGAKHSFDYRGNANAAPGIVSYQLSDSICFVRRLRRFSWLVVSPELREKVTGLIARMLSRHEPGGLYLLAGTEAAPMRDKINSRHPDPKPCSLSGLHSPGHTQIASVVV